jgi:Xaa-Pro aminopeptidase
MADNDHGSTRTLANMLGRGVLIAGERGNKGDCNPIPSSLSDYEGGGMEGMSTLQSVRVLMKDMKLDAFLLSTGDPHQSEYVTDRDLLVAFLSGVHCSSATIVVTQNEALFWTDGRYFLAASKELGPEWTLMRSLDAGVPTTEDWLSNNTAIRVVGVDPWLISASRAKQLTTAFKGTKELVAVADNTVTRVWGDRPKAPMEPVALHDIKFAGVTHKDKIATVQRAMAAEGVGALLVSMLDEVAWLLNIRGSDIAFNPVCLSYVIVTSQGAQLFIDRHKLCAEVEEHLLGVEILPYEAVDESLRAFGALGKVWVDETQVSWHLASIVESSSVNKMSPITLPKSIKNQAELAGIRAAHVRDGAALTAFICWLHQAVRKGQIVSEYDVAVKVEEFRARMPLHKGPSFDTIAGYGPNGAIIHYKPKEASALLGTDTLFLLDSGAQYLDGTTDVTRTLVRV